MFSKRWGLVIILLIASLITGAQAATLYGTIYEWSDFEKPLKNTIVEVNSTPAQYVVATTGTYSFNLSTGNYLVKAKYYRNNILEYSTEEYVRIDTEGDFVRDLLLFPPTDSEFEYLGDINLTNESELKNDTNINNYIIPILILLLVASAVLYLIKRKKTGPAEMEEQAKPSGKILEITDRELPSDLKELYEIILKNGGRTTQKELRKKLAFSEAKVSLMLDDLEDRGLIKKIRKGRSNIIIAQTQK